MEFNELEQDALSDTEVNLEFSELDIDFLEADFLRDLLDVIEELEKTTVKLADAQATSGGDFSLRGATLGKNTDSQYNIFVEDGGIVFYRDVQGVIRIRVPIGSSTKLVTNVEGYEGIIDLDGGDDSLIVITQEWVKEAIDDQKTLQKNSLKKTGRKYSLVKRLQNMEEQMSIEIYLSIEEIWSMMLNFLY